MVRAPRRRRHPRLCVRAKAGDCPQGIIDLPESIRRTARNAPTRLTHALLRAQVCHPPAKISHQRAALSQETASYGGGEGRQTKAPQRRRASEAKSRPRGIVEKNGKPTDTISHVRHQRSLDRTGGLNKGEFLAHRNVHRSGWLFRFLVAQTSQTGRTCYAHT